MNYRLSDLLGFSEAELISALKAQWDYEESDPLDVIGRLKAIPASKGGTFYILEQLRHPRSGALLFYPLEEGEARHTVFIGDIKQGALTNSDLNDGMWIKARTQLSPAKERDKHGNPFALKALTGSLQSLASVPESLTFIEHGSAGAESEALVEKWVVDFYREKHLGKIEQEGQELLSGFEGEKKQEQKKLNAIKSDVGILTHKVTERSEELQKVEETYANTLAQYEGLAETFNQNKKSMEHQLNILNQFIESKARMLLDLDLIEQSEYEQMVRGAATDIKINGHDVQALFNSDPERAVSYIQAYMMHQGIVYRRKVLEDFYALVNTHDLIVLAGDSGSGKTNLIKSFAKAIGGKSVIVPVKPNWTSAEDLLGYYNPIEQKYLPTPFLEALLEASRNPNTPYFICLDEMNLARVEYYFADFLSLMEERGSAPEVALYSDTEGSHLVSEAKNFLALIEEAKNDLGKTDLISFLDLLKDEKVNAKLHDLCGFREGDSLLKYHAQLRKLMNSYLNTPSKITLPSNVRIIGAINVDETTHYLSPKILDRAHVMRFSSPLLADWAEIEAEVEQFDLDMSLPLPLGANMLGERTPYPKFDRHDSLVKDLIYLVQEFLEPMGVEFGLRTVRQARLYSQELNAFQVSEALVLNNIVLHKVLPKLMFDGDKMIKSDVQKKDVLIRMRDHLAQKLAPLVASGDIEFCVTELDRVIHSAESNDWVVNYWAR